MGVAIWLTAAMLAAHGDLPSLRVQSGNVQYDRLTLECAEGAAALSDIRARLAVLYGTEKAGRACAAFVATGGERFFGQLAIVAVPAEISEELKGDKLLGLYGLRPDGGWTDLTEGTFLYDPETDILMTRQSTSEMPSVHVERGRSRVVHLFDPRRGIYWAVRAE